MEQISKTIETVIRELTTQKTAAGGEGPEAWLRKALTKKELGHIKFHYFRKGVLGILVDSSVWLYSLNLKKEALLKKIQGSSREVKEVRLSIGDLK